MATMSKVQEALKAMETIEKLKADAIAELLEQRGKIDEQLSQLGHTEGKRSSGKKTQRHLDPDKPCTVCNFATVPNHDARKHRAQGDDKKPFTAKQLEELGMKKA